MRDAFRIRTMTRADADPARYGDVFGFPATRAGILYIVRPSWPRQGLWLAPGAQRAEALFTALAERMPAGEALFLDVPEPNRDALALRHDMQLAFATARMYIGPAPALARFFGVTTFELG